MYIGLVFHNVMLHAEDASVGKPAIQSGTLDDRSADYAVDGNGNSTNPSTCATAIYVDESLDAVAVAVSGRAWWQVNLGDFYLVKAITVHFPTTHPGWCGCDDVFLGLYTNTRVS